jgi:hypothetical protein
LEALDDVIMSVKEGSFDASIEKLLPNGKKTGKILREDYWRIYPVAKKNNLRGTTQDMISKFADAVKNQPKSHPANRFAEMTSGLFTIAARAAMKPTNMQNQKYFPPRIHTLPMLTGGTRVSGCCRRIQLKPFQRGSLIEAVLAGIRGKCAGEEPQRTSRCK